MPLRAETRSSRAGRRLRTLAFVCACLLGSGAASAAPPKGALSLSEAYRIALRQSEQVEQAIGTRDLADTNYTGALTLMGPTVGINSRATVQNELFAVTTPGQPATAVTPLYSWNTSASINVPLFRRQIFDARRAAALGIDGAEATLRRTRQQLMFAVATAFIGVLQGRQQVTIAQGAVKRAESQLQLAVNRFKAGAALKTAELLAQIDLNRAQTQLNTAEGALRTADSTFERLIGVPPPETLVLPPSPQLDASVDTIDGSTQIRGDLRALHFATLQARATVSLLQSKLFWPTLDAIVQGSYNRTSFSAVPSYGLTGVLNVPLFQGGDEWVQIKLQKRRVGIAAAQESFLRRQVGDDVRVAIARRQTAEKAIEIATEQQKFANANYQAVSLNYKVGTATLLELITAQSAIFEADTNKALASYDRELASYQLLYAQGKIDL